MTTIIVFAGTTDGFVQSRSAVYLTARAGGGTLSVDLSSADLPVGQTSAYAVNQSDLEFDTSVLGSGAAVTEVTLSLVGRGKYGATAFDVEARAHDWGGGSLTGADFVAGDDISGKTLLATQATSTMLHGSPASAANYNDFVSESDFLTSINLTGFTRIGLFSSRQKDSDVPVGDEYVIFNSANSIGTSVDPKLIIEATLPIAGSLFQTEADDTVSATAKVALKGALAQTEADDTLGAAIFTVSLGEISVKHGGVWKVPTTYVKYDGVWIEPIAGYVKDAGTWQRVL